MKTEAHHDEQSCPKDKANDAKENFLAMLAKEKKYMNRFKLRHKIIFAFLVFFGINLVWYGMWMIISDIPVLNNPVIALILGVIILIATGFFYENLISADFNKKRSKERLRNDDVN